MSQNLFFWQTSSSGVPIFSKTKVRAQMVPCGNNRLGLTPNSSDYLGISSFYMCPETVNFQIYGSLAANSTSFLEIAVRDCNQTQLSLSSNNTKQCMPVSKSARVSSQLKLYIVF